jgi:hypothetical protein
MVLALVGNGRPGGLGRLPSKPDSRNALYSAATQLHPMEAVRSRSYSWDVPITLDQGDTPTCVGNGFAHELAAKPVVVGGVTEPFAQRWYGAAKRYDEYEGEDYDGTSVHGGAKVGRLWGWYKNYWWINSEEELASVVGHKGPVVIGVNWYTGMMRPDAHNRLNLKGSVEGGHCVLVRGVSIRSDCYEIHNSWGEDWGRKGNAYIMRKDMAFLLSEDGEAMWPERNPAQRTVVS